MSVDTINSCIILPNQADWDRPFTLKRKRKIQVVEGMEGQEDRLLAQARALVEVSYDSYANTPKEASRLSARILAAKKAGRVCAPIWGRQQYFSGTIQNEYVQLDGLYNWKDADYAFFMHNLSPWSDINKDIFINAGGSDDGDYVTDKWHSGTSSTISISDTQNLSEVVDFNVPTQSIYKKARETNGGSLTYTIQGLQPGVKARIRLHFSEISSTFYGETGDRRVFDINAYGATKHTVSTVQPFKDAGYNKHWATVREFSITPRTDGTIIIVLNPKAAVSVVVKSQANLNLATTHSTIDGVSLSENDKVLVAEQTDKTENGVYYLNGSSMLVRYLDADYVEDNVFLVTGGTDINNNYWLKADYPIVFGKHAIEWLYALYTQNTIINALEIYQYSWEVKALDAGSIEKRPSWSGRLKGVYEANHSVVIPAILGQLDSDSVNLTTDWHKRFHIKVSEPLGQGTIAASGQCSFSCPTDTTLYDPIHPGNDTLPGWTEGANTFDSPYQWIPSPLISDYDAIKLNEYFSKVMRDKMIEAANYYWNLSPPANLDQYSEWVWDRNYNNVPSCVNLRWLVERKSGGWNATYDYTPDQTPPGDTEINFGYISSQGGSVLLFRYYTTT